VETAGITFSTGRKLQHTACDDPKGYQSVIIEWFGNRVRDLYFIINVY